MDVFLRIFNMILYISSTKSTVKISAAFFCSTLKSVYARHLKVLFHFKIYLYPKFKDQQGLKIISEIGIFSWRIQRVIQRNILDFKRGYNGSESLSIKIRSVILWRQRCSYGEKYSFYWRLKTSFFLEHPVCWWVAAHSNTTQFHKIRFSSQFIWVFFISTADYIVSSSWFTPVQCAKQKNSLKNWRIFAAYETSDNYGTSTFETFIWSLLTH